MNGIARLNLAHALQTNRTTGRGRQSLRRRHARAFHAEKDAIKPDEIAVRLIHALRKYQRSHERPIQLHQVKQSFEEMKDHA